MTPEIDRGPHLPPRPLLTCACGRLFLDVFAFTSHHEACGGDDD